MGDVQILFISLLCLVSFVAIALFLVIRGLKKEVPKEITKINQEVKKLKTQVELQPIAEIQHINKEQVTVDEVISLPAISEFHLDEPPCIRAALMEEAAAKVHSHFINNFGNIIDTLISNNPGMDSALATIYATSQINKVLNPYREKSIALVEPFRITLYNAHELEKNNPSAAATLYEKVVLAGFTSSMPYERLRIIYSKQKQYEKAISACQNYISTLQKIQSFNPNYSNIKLITEYQQHIDKLTAKLNASL